jgi:hypothetical protein
VGVVEAAAITAASSALVVCMILMVRWQLSAGEFPHASWKSLLTRSDDPRAERRRRQFLASGVPVVILGWVAFLVSQ